VVWGVNFSVLKLGLDVVPAQVFNGARMGLAAGIFVVLLAVRRQLRWQRGDGWRLLALGMIGHAGYQVLFIEGLARTAAGNSSLILASVPMWVAIIGAVAGFERVTARAWIGIGLAFLGVLVVILGTNRTIQLPGLADTGSATASLLGDGLVLLSTLCWSFYTALSKPLLARYSPVQVSGLSLAGAFPVLALTTVYDGVTTGWGAWTPAALGAVFFGGVLSVNVCYVIWYAGVQRLGGARTAVFSNITPLVAILTAWLWRGEALHPVYALGAGLIAGGVLLTRFSRPAVPRDPGLAAEADSAVGTG
jgi:drug/metabolite transporter (DMT)-like permease